MTLVLVTGASGFVGSELAPFLATGGFAVRGAYRAASDGSRLADQVIIGEVSAATDWRQALAGADVVVHLAGPPHTNFSRAALNEQIVQATATLAEQAEAAGVRRFVYVSSVKATRSCTSGKAVDELQAPAPDDDYGRAKLSAEKSVLGRPGLKPVILRPPLVIAPNAKANFARLLRLAASGLPLPVAATTNRRSVVSLASLIEAIRTAITNEAHVGVFHIADAPPLSTAEIVTALRKGMDLPPRLFAAPTAFLPPALRQSLEVDDAAFRAAFGEAWSRDARQALVECGAAWKARQ